jgi:hypothetical protein
MACLQQYVRNAFWRNGKGETDGERNDEKTDTQMVCERNTGEGR